MAAPVIIMPAAPDYAPTFPEDRRRLGIGILGAGKIAQSAHLPAYEQYGLRVAGVWSRRAETTETVPDRFRSVGRVYSSPDELLEDPAVDVVDLATGPEDRAMWLHRAVQAGKHVLAQKPLSFDLDALLPVLEEADDAGVRIAVNQNARWAPPWRLATLLLAHGSIGEVVGVTHLHDKPLPPLPGTPFDTIPHMLVSDYLVHWVDITRCWLSGTTTRTVRASDHRTPAQPEEALNPWSATVQVDTAQGASALLRVVGNVHTATPSCPFWIHGTEGTIRGSLLGRDYLELDAGATVTRFPLHGAWFVDGFAGTIGELMCSVEQGRQPTNSARNNIATLRMVLAARESADKQGAVVALEEPL